MAEQKTNVMRTLEQKKIKYTAHEYPHGDEAVDGMTVARILGIDPMRIFKTLVARGASKNIYVFALPVSAELDLKKPAKAAGEKSLALVHVSEINALTGYVRGGCSPIGMKKRYATFFDESSLRQETVLVSAGRIGRQVELSPDALIGLTTGKTANIISEE